MARGHHCGQVSKCAGHFGIKLSMVELELVSPGTASKYYIEKAKRDCGILKKKNHWQSIISQDIPGGPVVENLTSNAEGEGSIPGRGTKIPLAMGQLSPCDLAPCSTTKGTEAQQQRACVCYCERSHMPQPRPDAAR